MAINRDSNLYTLSFAAIMVVLVGGLLAFVSLSLNPIQKANQTNEKMQNILQAIGIEETATVSRDEAGAKFNNYVKRRITIDFNGNVLSDLEPSDAINPQNKLDAFNINIRKEYSRYIKPIMNANKGDDDKIKSELAANQNIHFPLFICENNGKKYMVTSCSGKGLWDDIWGYIGFESDGKTISGAIFDHKGETPGLGSVITEDWFEQQFKSKSIDENGYAAIQVLKPGKNLNNHQVDGISGATFTGVGVDEMMGRSMEVYYNFVQSNPDILN